MKTNPADPFAQRNHRVQKAVNETFRSLQGTPLEVELSEHRHRAGFLRMDMEARALHLTRGSDGLLRWHMAQQSPQRSPGLDALTGARRARAFSRAAPLISAPPVLTQTLFDSLEPSKLGEWLAVADRKLTPDAWNSSGQLWGLRCMKKDGTLVPLDSDQLSKLKGKKVLLFIHGTFSNCDAAFDDLKKAPGGNALFAAALGKYDFILCFDHPTLGQSPMINAFDLASRLMHGQPSRLHIIAHSRGGLVARWFCEGFRPPGLKCHALLVGSPLVGTSLASPARARAAMDFLANVGDAVGTVTALGGGIILGVASTLAGLFARVTGALSTPLADAVIALVPGLAAQSRAGNNAELRALRVNTGMFQFSDRASKVRYSVIKSNFSPTGDGIWSFLKSFVTRPGATLLDTAADFVFQEDNDLVVNTSSMNETGEYNGKSALITDVAHDFSLLKSKTVHHCNYFQQHETVDAIRKTFRF